MRRFYISIYSIFAVLSLMLICSGCVEHLEEPVYEPTEYVAFKASLSGESRAVPTKGFTGCLDFEEEEWAVELDSKAETKITMYNSLNGLEAGVYGYVYNGTFDDSSVPVTDIKGHKYIFDGDQLDAVEPIRWNKVDAVAETGYKFRAFAYAPKEAITPSYQNTGSNSGAPVIGITDITSYQKDILVADKEVEINKESKAHRKQIPLDFEHIFTAIQFKAGFACTITSITISNIKTSGDYVLGTGWSGSATSTLTLTLNRQLAKGETIDPILMIPQKFGEGATISLVIDGDTSKPLTADLNGVEWRQGKKITYTLIKESDREYIYLDLAAGNITITGKSYEGKVFVKTGDQIEAKTVKGTIGDKQKYYIYQSCVTDYIKNHTDEKFRKNYKSYFTSYTDKGDNDKSASGTFTPPVYDPVKGPDGRLWSDYITNNTSVENVIEAWDNSAGATDNTSIDNTKAVRKVGRESTKNKIHITGAVGTCNMIIDNIYTSYHHKPQNRDYGSIGFIPTWNTNSSLVLHLIGDNRLGCIHYDNSQGGYGSNTERLANTNKLIIEGEGSLTVADADFVKSGGGYYSNHYDSAIGNADDRNSTYGIVINSGTVFAGTTKAENSSAIGAGGNGYGDVVINGGVVTAVASTTGTAIGGGIGYSDTGGKGYVEINGGNVYAYNHENISGTIPSSAIGGAGSKDSAGSQGTIIITGGNIYAQSELGTAIGGGSSYSKNGGDGNITITGGYVIAKSLSSISAGIGGGSTCTGGGTLSNPNGGNAIITVGVENDPSKSPIVRTGSIGGGGTGATGGTVGNAQVNVYGGDIQAQFVMAQSDGNIFNMTGGLIRNSSTSDNEYYCIKEHGGAVYMEKGTFTMSGGTIKECAADKTSSAKGGAVYIKGDAGTKFTMSGGTIQQCKANSNGGAVYLEGGSVTINGGTIEGNVAYKGNGGAICIMGGDFTMNSTSAPASISENAAFGSGTTGNGGGIYVAPASSTSSSAITVKLTKGSITSNSADQYGGGVCVDMGTNSVAKLNVTVGTESSIDVAATNNPDINANSALIKGGGMYVNGAKANVTLYDGNILNNETSSYQVNPDISVVGGLVTLEKPGITTQVTVTFSNNAQYYTSGATDDTTVEQYIVAASDNKLDANTFSQINDYYNEFIGWNTKRDGSGTAYTNEQIVSLNENITLYAQWK